MGTFRDLARDYRRYADALRVRNEQLCRESEQARRALAAVILQRRAAINRYLVGTHARPDE
jgi:hypothetical protein